MFRIAICDDNSQELETTCRRVMEFIARYSEKDISVMRFQSANVLLEVIQGGGRFQIYLLDILMPNVNGIEMGMHIREKDQLAVIIYLTSSPDFALQSYQVSAFQYLTKPIQPWALFDALERAMARIDQDNTKSILVKTRDGITAVRYHQIIYVEYVEHSAHFYLSDGSVVISVTSREPFESLTAQILQDIRFIKPHISYVLNMAQVRTLTNRDFLLINAKMIPISRKNYAAVKKQYIDFLLKTGGMYL